VQRHGGSLDVESTPGQGACFTVALPRLMRAARNDADNAAGRATDPS
jgi:K+-sensing histidine kinase KdpD